MQYIHLDSVLHLGTEIVATAFFFPYLEIKLLSERFKKEEACKWIYRH
ncbi:MAG TPA: hypothetical protein VFQ58_04795 [Flavisolibacter sp.]|jgi:hypothetical protein|nr:hypothetical protein [Flavisolibacter sp.]